MKTLILGGMKSGKSKFAEQIASTSNKQVTYIATAQAWDNEMRARIAAHKTQRPETWQTIEESLYIAQALKNADNANSIILIDCLTLWITQLLCHENTKLITQEITQFHKTLANLKADLICVSNETNMGIIPMDALSRRFCDETGKLHQQLATSMDNVILTVAGLPLYVKGKA